MENYGTKFLWKCVPTRVEKDLTNGTTVVSYQDENGILHKDTFDTVLLAVGKLRISCYCLDTRRFFWPFWGK